MRNKLFLALALLPLAGQVLAQSAGLPALTSTPAGGGGTTYSLTIQTLLLLTAMTFIPAAILMMTSFTRIVIVLSLLRHAMGTQTAPPNQIIVGLALFLTFFIMSPTIDRIYSEAYVPLSENRLNVMQAGERAVEPLRAFMLKHTREADIAMFAGVARITSIEKPEDVPLRILIPSFVISELKTAFQIGFVLFIPFLIIDMVVASILMSMGMMMMSPIMVALPFKLMLFVLVDGWHLIIGSLVQSFNI
ncbi:flagellar biosynthetic protein FliP [Azonexus fungiphilus]|uniref:Flagellar biosynthetic protein FliP n=1 Tax=Azonexus fungiphilus TaxID=146940 RepID=A0A495VLY5_9RHOO|nr:flagellar type III secretion system pore protein FliP [Azonexus fungiphilus]RKT50411.1 flagellar biosynthetic protein FliP [Azonexus fungiphilus]